jgi:dipeptidyl aminopeptidase/acylaminoacyl peptidase
MARTGLSLQVQFWTSRGWGVVDVNYGGSTGFGRAYRERLDGGWGVVDVDDCLAAARALVESGRADPVRIAMEGSSASGFTVLAAMARGDTIRAGAIRYPVTDLTALAEADHRFEARYFDALVGPWPAARAIYEQRSPLQQVDRINAPLLFFHGLEDTVVPAEQSVVMVERLRQRGVPVELHLFEGEGHGFRDGVVQRQVLERSEAFFRERFALAEAA